jgi:hypothetical protein
MKYHKRNPSEQYRHKKAREGMDDKHLKEKIRSGK